jgi:hypothetical protein
MRNQTDDDIWFVVTYDDGRTVEMRINRWHLRTGDHVAWFIAGERQRAQELPQGKIVDIKRTIR